MTTPTGKRREELRKASRAAFANELVRVVRNHPDIVQSELGRRLGVQQNTVSTWMSGSSVPQHSVIYEIEQVLGLRPGHLTRYFGCYPRASLDRPAISVEEAVYADPTLDDIARQTLMAVYAVHSRQPAAPRRVVKKAVAAR